MCQAGHIKVEYVNTKYNISDLFTKGVCRVSKETFLALDGFLIGREPISKSFEAIRHQMEQGNEEPQGSPWALDTSGSFHRIL